MNERVIEGYVLKKCRRLMEVDIAQEPKMNEKNHLYGISLDEDGDGDGDEAELRNK